MEQPDQGASTSRPTKASEVKLLAASPQPNLRWPHVTFAMDMSTLFFPVSDAELQLSFYSFVHQPWFVIAGLSSGLTTQSRVFPVRLTYACCA
jgi:hypothetical protein